MADKDLVNEKLLNDLLLNKVDKDGSKILSTNDFTNADKSKLDGISAEANKVVVLGTTPNGYVVINGTEVRVFNDTELRGLIAGKETGWVIDTQSQITGTKDINENYTNVTAIGTLELSLVKIGDNVYIKDTDVPDYWVSEKTNTGTEDAPVWVLSLNTLSTKIDLNNYYNKTEISGIITPITTDVSDLKTKTTNISYDATSGTTISGTTNLDYLNIGSDISSSLFYEGGVTFKCNVYIRDIGVNFNGLYLTYKDIGKTVYFAFPLKTSDDTLACVSDIPHNTSQLLNDSGFITASSIPTNYMHFDSLNSSTTISSGVFGDGNTYIQFKDNTNNDYYQFSYWFNGGKDFGLQHYNHTINDWTTPVRFTPSQGYLYKTSYAVGELVYAPTTFTLSEWSSGTVKVNFDKRYTTFGRIEVDVLHTSTEGKLIVEFLKDALNADFGNNGFVCFEENTTTSAPFWLQNNGTSMIMQENIDFVGNGVINDIPSVGVLVHHIITFTLNNQTDLTITDNLVKANGNNMGHPIKRTISGSIINSGNTFGIQFGTNGAATSFMTVKSIKIYGGEVLGFSGI